MAHLDLYQHFPAEEQIFESEAKLFSNDGHFALKRPIVITQMENLLVLHITPRATIKCMPIFVAFDQSGPGHYDASIHRIVLTHFLGPQINGGKFGHPCSSA